MLVEHAVNNLNIPDAVHAEYGKDGTAIISQLACSLNGTQITVRFQPGSKLRDWHGSSVSIEQTTCNYGLNTNFQYLASESGLMISAVDATGEVRAIERPDHPYFVGTLYQPQLTSEPGSPHPVLHAFVRAVLQTNTISPESLS